MNRRVLCLVLMLAGLVVVGPSPAQADCQWVRIAEVVNGQLRVHFEHRCEAATSDSPGGATPIVSPPRDSDWDAICVRTALVIGENPADFCDLPPGTPASAVPMVTPGLVARAFRNIPLPASELRVQPPGGETLVNFATNFYTERGGFSRTVRLLGRQVELRIWPSRFVWVFGDGASLGSVGAGSPYPDLEITHEYRWRGEVGPRVDTTYAAQFRVGGGAWRDVVGTVTVPGAAVRLVVRTARPVLVGYR